MKCTTCSKPISGKYRIAGKAYGYDCYRLKLAEIRAIAELAAMEERNAEHTLKCAAAMAVFASTPYRSEWLQKFQVSITAQWDACHKLTAKQLGVILSKIDEVEYGLTYLALAPEDRWLTERVINRLSDAGRFSAEHVQDERLADLIRHAHHNRQRGTYVLIAVDDKGCGLDVWGQVHEGAKLPPVAYWRLWITPAGVDESDEDLVLAIEHNLAYVLGTVSPTRRKSLGA
jgi:hypothetical protein